ncbi:MAG: sulfite exporter TauE/SafE family protein [Solirubrobacterales bacterium]|nr:sulfite exporter TauE/SafE family protein [Solirubrobacterales bacterium]
MLAASTSVAFPLAFAAGMLSFFSPFVLPLVPGYISVIAGVTPADLQNGSTRRVLVPSLIFVASFSFIFILLGLSATQIGSWLQGNKLILQKASGLMIIAMGLLFMLSPFIPQLSREWHPGGLIEKAGRGGPVVAGIAFAIAWTPCIGPTLTSILLVASNSGSPWKGASLLAFYSLGLALPFLGTALFFGWASSLFAAVKRHYAVLIVGGGAILVITGVFIFTGQFFQLNAQAQKWLQDLGISDPGSI